MSIENRNLSSPMPALTIVFETGNNIVFAFTRARSKAGRTPTMKARNSGGRCRRCVND